MKKIDVNLLKFIDMGTLAKLRQFLNVCVDLVQTLQVSKNKQYSDSHEVLESTTIQYC